MSRQAALGLVRAPTRQRERTASAEPVATRPRQGLRAPIWAMVTVITAVAVSRYLAGRTSVDLPVFDQALWAASRGHSAFSTVVMENLLGDHFGPGLLAFIPLYRIWASPIWLLVGQGIATGVAIQLIVRRLAPAVGNGAATVAGLLLLASPPVAHALLFDAHAVVFATPFALAAIFAIEDGRRSTALVFGLLAAVFRVEIGLAVLVAHLVLPGRRERRRAIAVETAYLVVAFLLEAKLGHSDSHWPVHFGYLGGSPIDAVLHPWRIAGALLSAGVLWKATPWLVTAGFVCFLRPRRMAPAVAAALPVLLSHWSGTSTLIYHYGFAPALLLAVAWIPAVAARPERLTLVVASGVILAMLAGPMNPSIIYGGRTFAVFAAAGSPATCLTRGIPAGAGVSGLMQPLGRLAHRDHLYVWPYPFAATPPDVLPSPDLAVPRPDLAAAVDYLIIPVRDSSRVPPGFVEDTTAGRSVRLRRAATTTPSPTCPAS